MTELTKVHGNKGRKRVFSEGHKANMSAARKNKVFSEEHKSKISAGWKRRENEKAKTNN